MATFDQLYDLRTNTSIKNKIAIAITIKAKDIIALTTPTANQLEWANKALTNPALESDKLMNYVLAANSSATVAQIEGATDAAVQTQVNTAVDKLIAGGVI